MIAKRWTLTIGYALLLLGGCQTQMISPLEISGYDEEEDVYVVFRGERFEDASSFLPIGVLGELAFDLQEGTHSSITHVSGVEVDHYYIWVCLGEQCIPVDPFTFSS